MTMADKDEPNKFRSEEGEMQFLSVEEINKLKLETEIDLDDDELDLDDIDEEDLERPEDED